jgi:hypothetical protein
MWLIRICAGLVDALAVDGGAERTWVFGLGLELNGPLAEAGGGEREREQEMALSSRALRRLS